MSTTEGEGNLRRAFQEIFASARTKETALLAELAMIEARLGLPTECEGDQPRVVEIVHRLKSLGCATHPEVEAIANGAPFPAYYE